MTTPPARIGLTASSLLMRLRPHLKVVQSMTQLAINVVSARYAAVGSTRNVPTVKKQKYFVAFLIKENVSTIPWNCKYFPISM